MSQRLLITKKENVTEEDNFFDCIYTEESNHEKLLTDWCSYDPAIGTYLGPFKIVIRDYNFFDKFMEDFKKLKNFISALASLEDVWTISDERGKIYQNENIEKMIQEIVKKIPPSPQNGVEQE